MKQSDMIRKDLALFQNLITCAHNLYFWTFNSNLENIYHNCPSEILLDYMSSSEVTTRFTNIPGISDPIVLTNSLDFFWIADFEKNIEGKLMYIHVIGPIFIEDISLKKIENDILSMHYTHQQKIDFIITIRTLPVLSITRFYEYGLMMHYCITGDKITVSDLQYPKTEKELPSEPEKEVIDAHGTWSFEQEMLKMVEDGNLNMKQFTSRMSSGAHLGSLGNGNPIRQLKNVTIIFTALCTRAAIRGGLPVNIAYTLSDRYITAIESCSTISDIVEINDMMQDDFVNRVHQMKLKAGLSPQIKNCCSYIDLHIKEPLLLDEIAKEIGYSKNYLCKKFKEEMGKTISDYVLEHKIALAKNLLLESSKNVHQIGEELGFHSHSYFCEKFKRQTGMSPSEFRNQISSSSI